MKEVDFLHLGKVPHQGRKCTGWRGRAAKGSWKAKWGVIFTEDWHCHSAFLNFSVGENGGQVLKLRLQSSVTGRRPGLAEETA